MLLLQAFAAILVVTTTLTQGSESISQTQLEKGRKRASVVANELYGTLKNIAFPAGNNPRNEIENRFLMLMPGKVLNYFDYFPGKEYTKFIQDYSTRRKESVVPPRVMEKWFDLSDAIPSPNHLVGQDTGKSLANVYKSILHEIKITGLEERTQYERHYYNQGVEFLTKQIVDPEDLSKNTTRLAVYERYRDQYNNRKLNMEDQIEYKRLNFGSLDYELWFQRHYPSLRSQVESAYTKWMVFGQKEIVELNIAYMDTGSSGQIIEEARAAMRAAGVESLDRTRTVFPVSFEPSDWYKYLLPKQERPSRDQLQAMLGKLQSRLDAIETTVDFVNNISTQSPNITKYVTKLKSQVQRAKNDAKKNLTSYLNLMYSCMTDKTGREGTCVEFEKAAKQTIDSLVSESDAYANSEFLSYLAPSEPNSNYVESLKKEASHLKDEISRIYSLLGEASPYLGGIIGASPLAIANLTEEFKDNQWLQFEYKSSEYYSETDETQDTSSSSTSGSGGFFFFGGSGSSSSDVDEREHENKLAMAKISVKGELLRVNIKRPWFKPEIFDDPGLSYVESDEDDRKTFISPGRGFPDETAYYTALTSNQRRYKLPEFTTSFLLARSIEMDFSGLDSSTSNYYMSKVTKSSGGGGFLFFRVQHSETKTKQVSHVVASKSASGMKIKIPGAQIIGYYTQTLPKFPQDQS